MEAAFQIYNYLNTSIKLSKLSSSIFVSFHFNVARKQQLLIPKLSIYYKHHMHTYNFTSRVFFSKPNSSWFWASTSAPTLFIVTVIILSIIQLYQIITIIWFKWVGERNKLPSRCRKTEKTPSPERFCGHWFYCRWPCKE